MDPTRVLVLVLVLALAGACGGPRDPAAAVVAKHRPAVYKAIDADVNCDDKSDSFFGCFGAEARLSLQHRVGEATTPLISELRDVQGSKESLQPLVSETLAAAEGFSGLLPRADECVLNAGRLADEQCEPVFDGIQDAERRLRDVLAKWNRHL